MPGLLPPAEQQPGGDQVSLPGPPRHHGHSFPGQAGQAGYICTATTEWRGEESSLAPLLQGGDRDQELSTSPAPALVTTREEGSTLCNVSGICVGNVVSYVDIEVGLYW